MFQKKLTSLIVCLAMLICILPAASTPASATSYSFRLQPGIRYLTVSPTNHTIDVTLSEGKTGSSIYDKPSWVTISNPNASTYRISVQVNSYGTQRTGTVIFKKNNKLYKLSITQSKNYINNVPSSKTVSAIASSFNFTVSVGTGSPIASSDKAWLTVKKDGSTFTVSYSANTGAARTGTITIQSGYVKATFSVTQSVSPRTAISGLQTDTTGTIYNDTWANTGRGSQLVNFYNALIVGGDSTAKSILGKAKGLATRAWTCQKTFTGYDGWTFTGGQVYYGTPYQQYGNYIGYGYSIDDLISNANNASSYFYTRDGSNGPGYGTDCSGFASYCGNTPWVKADEFSGQTSYFTKITNSSEFATKVKSGDVLHRNGHVLLVASVYREGGRAKGIVILESRNRTTASGRNIYVYYDNDEVLKKLFGGASLSNCHTYIKNVVWGGTETVKQIHTLIHVGTVNDFVSSFSKHTLLSKK